MTRWWPSTASSSAGHGPQGQRAEELLGDQGQQEDGQRPGQGGAEPPAEGVVRPEQPHARGDHPLADRRVHDVFGGVQQHAGVAGDEGVVGLVRPAPLVAADQERVGVLDVIRLVKDEACGGCPAGRTAGRRRARR